MFISQTLQCHDEHGNLLGEWLLAKQRIVYRWSNRWQVWCYVGVRMFSR